MKKIHTFFVLFLSLISITLNEKTTANCSQFHEYFNERGLFSPDCMGRIGNQIGNLAFALAVYYRFGVTAIFIYRQLLELGTAFDVGRICKKFVKGFDGFCVEEPRGMLSAGFTNKNMKYYSICTKFQLG